MQLDFGEREPQDLEIPRGYDLILGIWLNGSGATEEKAYPRLSPPPEDDLLELFKKAAALSKGQDEEIGFPVYVAQKLVRKGGGEESVQPIALFYKGMIEEYCRPPWRVSRNVLE